MDLNKQRGSRIESLRASKGISQLELAKMLGYKSDSTISKWESGASIPTGTKIVKLAQANRDMIRGLLENESLDDFNYVRFMKKYNLTTICDETFVKNEYLKLLKKLYNLPRQS